MTPERRAQIIDDVLTIRMKLGSLHTAFKNAVEADWKAAAAAEFKTFLQKDHGKRLPKLERDRIQREITSEHRARWREQAEEWYSHRQLAHADEAPKLDAYLRECQRPNSVDEEFRRRHPEDGRDVGAMLLTGLLEMTARKDIRATVLGRTDIRENLERFRMLQGLNGGSPVQQIILETIEAQEIEAHENKWSFDPKDDTQATAARLLNAAIAEARQKRGPTELVETIAESKAAQSFAATRQQALRLRLLSPDELGKAIERAEQQSDENEGD